MEIEIRRRRVEKRVPLRISRGVSSYSENIELRVSADGCVGLGEAVAFGDDPRQNDPDSLVSELEAVAAQLEGSNPLQRQRIHARLDEIEAPTAARAAVDCALWDWAGRAAGRPVWQLLGLDRDRIPPTSVTVGVMPAGEAADRLDIWRDAIDFRIVKIKVGSGDGLSADRQLVDAVRRAAPEARLTVDANGAWTVEEAVEAAEWLADRGVEHLEQPLPPARDDEISELRTALDDRGIDLPIVLDESCRTAPDVVRLAGRGADAINIKLMKCGGLTEALRMIGAARAVGAKVMFGCFSHTALANTAAAQLSPLADWIDLDSHLNLVDDPYDDPGVDDGRLWPSRAPGFGIDPPV